MRRFLNILSLLSSFVVLMSIALGLRSCSNTDHYIWDTSDGSTRVVRLNQGQIELYCFKTKLPQSIERGTGWTIPNKPIVPYFRDWDAVVVWGTRNSRTTNERDERHWATVWDRAYGVRLGFVAVICGVMPYWRISNSIRRWRATHRNSRVSP